jgi:hypothetical protein
MAESHVITALSKKRAELSGDIERMHLELSDKIKALEKLDATLLLFDPEYEIASIKPKAFRPPEDWSKRGEMTRIILGIMRKATEPLTSADIAAQLIAERALEPTEKLQRLMTKRVGVALRGLRDRGVAVSAPGPGMSVLWLLSR